MLRLSFIALISVFAILFIISLLPKTSQTIPDEAIKLANVSLTLYPQEDPNAVWDFKSPSVEYKPESRETVLYNIKDAARRIDDEIDFTIESEKIIIASDDNIWGEKIKAQIIGDKNDPSDDYFLDMEAKNDRQVLINQRQGEFEIPHLQMTSEGSVQIYENVFTDFAIEEFRAGGEGTVGYASFEIENSQ